VRHHPDSPQKYSEVDIKSMLGFLVDSIYVVFGDQVFQQPFAIPMDTRALILLLFSQTFINMKQICSQTNTKDRAQQNLNTRYLT
jgi:hypothetical protein